MQIIFVLIIGFFLLLPFVIGFFNFKKEKERSAMFVEIAADLHMSVSNKVDRSFRNQLKPFDRFERGRYVKFRNILHENNNNMEMVFFECFRARSTNPNGGAVRVMEGIFYFKSSTLDLPRFFLHEANVIQQTFFDFMGLQSIDFKKHRVFSNKYFLSGDNEAAITSLFSEKLIRFLEGVDGVNIEGSGNQMIVYRPYTRIDINEFEQRKLEAVKIFEQFRE